MLNYKEQLADSRWLKKKNEILERDGYTCQKCGRTSHLNVHHLNYERGKLAWEYPNEKLVTMCEYCHSQEHGTTQPYVGEVYAFEHSDFTNYSVCYGINKHSKEVYLVGFDNGGSWDTPIIECVSMDSFKSKYLHLRDFWQNYKDDCDEIHWIHYILLKILTKFHERKHTIYEVSGFVHPKESVYNYLCKNIDSVVNRDECLLMLFNKVLNEN